MEYLKARATLTAYASDASIYSITPYAIKRIYKVEDILKAVELARRRGLSITPRGGGTGLAGGALGSGIVLDFGSFENILEIDPDRQTVVTQVGVIYDELSLFLKRYGLFFPPDPSSGDSCQIGGMIASNSSGPKSVKYGLTSHFVEELKIVTPSGKLIDLKKMRLGSRELMNFLGENSEYQRVFDILQKSSQLIKDNWPKVKKNSAGYNLLQVISDFDRGIFNMPALMVGSEGTLCLFVSARLRLLPLPKEILTARLYFKSLVDAGKAVASILEIAPSGLEIIDGTTLDLIGRAEFDIPRDAAALLLIEFDEDIKSARESFLDLADKLDLADPVDFAEDSESAAALWRCRKAIVPTLYRHHPSKRPIPLVEDVSLPIDQIPTFIEYITSLFASHNLAFGLFGHIGDGNLHIRPLLDLNDSDDLDLAQWIYKDVYDKVISIGGSTTAEHADGRLRASVLKKLYGEELFAVFKGIKETLDPDNIFSPDSILSEVPFTEKIDYEKIKSYCAACGKCNGYCPVYDLFRREDFSPRGWLRILNQSGESRRKLDKYLSYCLNCKNCTNVCPAGVDIASEIINYRSIKPSIISKTVIGFADTEPLFNLSLKLGRIAEPLLKSPYGSMLIALTGKKSFGFDRSVSFPAIAGKPLRKRFTERISDFGEVALFHGCADNLLESNVGEAIFEVFDHLGIKVLIPEQKCCGLPQEVYGHRENLIEKARFNIDRLIRFDSIITGCASCLLKLKEYEKLFDDGSRYKDDARTLAAKCFDVSQYLNNLDIDYAIFDSEKPIKVTYHNPCHLRAAGFHKEPEKLIRRLNNVEIVHPMYADQCCAQAGSYGFVHFQESKAMFKKKRYDYNETGAEYIMTSCPACKMKIHAEMGEEFKVVHPVEILAERLRRNHGSKSA